MELLCASLLSGKFGFLDSTSFGFEVLSTNLVKIAIAASMVVSSSDRMSVQELLKEKLGFFY